MMGTSLHTLVQMVDNGLGLTFVPGMAIEAGILANTGVDARPLSSDHSYRRIALIWRRSSARENEFRLLATALQQIMSDLARPPRGARAPAPGRARRFLTSAAGSAIPTGSAAFVPLRKVEAVGVHDLGPGA